MKLAVPRSLKDLATLIGAEMEGSPDHMIKGINEIHRVEEGDLVFVDHPKYYDKALKSRATTVLINKRVDCPSGKALLISPDPFRDYNKLVTLLKPVELSLKLIGENTHIGSTTRLMSGVVIGNNVTIGEQCILHPNVVIYNDCTIGNNVVIHAGTVIGADAFYYKRRENHFDKMISCGRVIIRDDVEIGALCTIDRGVSDDTVIGKGTKIDNHVQIGHDTQVGEMCLFAAHVGIAGAVTIEDKVTLWGQVGIPSGIVIGKGTVVLGQSGLAGSVEGNATYFGSPAMEAREKMKELVMVKRIPELMEKISQLEKKIK